MYFSLRLIEYNITQFQINIKYQRMADNSKTIEIPASGKIKPEIDFIQIHYPSVRQINYVQDFISQCNPNTKNFDELNLSQLREESIERNPFDGIADNLYKKIVKQGYIEKPSAVTKKTKKGSDANFYNSTDLFIDDEECCIQKKDKHSKFQDYKCLDMSIEELYDSQLYRDKVQDLIIQVNKRKANFFNLNQEDQIQKFDQIKKKIKKSIKDMIVSKQMMEKEKQDESGKNQKPKESAMTPQQQNIKE